MLKKTKITEGCYIVCSDNTSVLFGCPSDIVKVFTSKHLDIPHNIVLPDIFFQNGINVGATEFLIANFIYKPADKIRNINIIGSKKAIKNQKIILGETFPSIKGVNKPNWLKNKKTENFVKYEEFFRLKKNIFASIKFKEIKNNLIKIGDIAIEQISPVSFSVKNGDQVENIDILIENQISPFFGVPNVQPPISIKDGIIIIGSGNGFSQYEENTSSIVFSDYVPIFVDGSPWEEYYNSVLGIDNSEYLIFVLTHNHDDHCSLLNLLFFNKKVKILTTLPIFNSFVKKASAILDISESEIKEGFQFIELIPDITKRIYGIDFTAHETIHSIPTIGIRIGKILVSGDTAWGSTLDLMEQESIITKDEKNKINSIPFDNKSKYIFMDSGGNLVHPNIQELCQIPEINRKKLILNHININNIPKNLGFLYGLFGVSYIVDKGYQPLNAHTLSAFFNNKLINKIDKIWQKVFLSRGKIKKFDHHQKTKTGKYSAFILNGVIQNEQGKKFGTGDFLGVFSSENFETISPTSILFVENNLVKECLEEEKLYEQFKKLDFIQNIFYLIPQLRRITNKQIVEAQESFEIKTIKKDTKIKTNNKLFIFVSGICTDSFGNKINKLQIIDYNSKYLNIEEDSKFIICDIYNLKNYISNIYIEKILKGEIL